MTNTPFTTRRKFVKNYQSQGISKDSYIAQIYLALFVFYGIPTLACPPLGLALIYFSFFHKL